MIKSSPAPAVSLQVVAFALTASTAFGQIMVNEIPAANDATNPDNSDFDDYADWIELRNTTAEEASLDGYYLSDDPTLPTRWAFPSGASIPANGYLLVWADGFDAGPAWSRISYDDTPWQSGDAQLGYGDGIANGIA